MLEMTSYICTTLSFFQLRIVSMGKNDVLTFDSRQARLEVYVQYTS